MQNGLDLRGKIGPVGVDAIQASLLYTALTANYGDVEIWKARNAPQDGSWYYWLVSRRETVRGLAFIRYNHETNRLQERIEGPFEQELWVDVTVSRSND
jgi:hypothetical protein